MNTVDARPSTYRFSLRGLLYLLTLVSISMAIYGGIAGIAVAAFLLFPHLLQAVLPQPNTHAPTAVTTLVITMLISWMSGPIWNATSAARESAALGRSHGNTKDLAQAVLAYRDTNGHFPPPYTTNEAGEKLHSWRTLILPYLGEDTLYEQIDLDEPYNSPTNLKAFEQVELTVMRCPQPFAKEGGPTETNYLAVVDDRTVWTPDNPRVNTVPDGEETTILLIEVAESGIDWFEPRDLALDQAVAVLTEPAGESLSWTRYGLFDTQIVSGRRLVASTVGRQAALGSVTSREDARAMLTRDGGEEAFAVREVRQQPRHVRRSIRWDRLFLAGLLFALAVVPLFEKTRKWLTS